MHLIDHRRIAGYGADAEARHRIAHAASGNGKVMCAAPADVIMTSWPEKTGLDGSADVGCVQL